MRPRQNSRAALDFDISQKYHVLFDDRKAVVIDLAQHIPEREEIHSTHRWLAEYIHSHGGGEWNLFRFDFLLDLPVNTFEMQVRKPIVMSLHKVHRIAAPIGVMTDIKAG